MLAALDSSTISRLHQTWAVSYFASLTMPSSYWYYYITGSSTEEPITTRIITKTCRPWTKLSRIPVKASQYCSSCGTIPRFVSLIASSSGAIYLLFSFLGLYLTDVTFCREGNPSHRASPMNPDKKLLNFNKYHKLARIVQGKLIRAHIHKTLLTPRYFSRYAAIPSTF